MIKNLLMKNHALAILTCLIILGHSSSVLGQQAAQSAGWKLGVQSWTFRNFSFAEALDRIKELNLRYVEAYPGQKIGGGIDGTMDYKMDVSRQKAILALLKSKGITLLSFGVVGPLTRQQWVTLFDFAKGMGLMNIVAEPNQEDMAYLSTLCNRYGVNIAIHNHPRPSHYWNPDALLNTLKLATGNRIGSCSDVGHWRRSGLNAVECLKKMQGKIKELHLKDVIDAKDPSEETVWGQGGNDMKGVFAELKRQNYRGPMFIEYESTPANNMSEIKQSVSFFTKTVAGL